MSAALFTPVEIGGLTFRNRIAVAPMCQYSADDGSATDWHMQHWMTLAMSGASMITIEATAVERRGRITHGCLGLYSDHNEHAAARTLAAARAVAAPGALFGVQLAHAGRKASTRLPWEGGSALKAGEDPWITVAPSAVPHTPDWHTPTELGTNEIAHVVAHFAAAARRAQHAGFDFVEIHGAHGYLAHEFLSPIANKRTDSYGGSLNNRMRFILEIADAVTGEVGDEMMVGARLSATDWADGGFDVDESIHVSRALKERGIAYICASSGGVADKQQPIVGPGYQVAFAARIREKARVPTRAVGLITEPAQAQAIIAEGEADMVALARPILADPRWPWRAAAVLGADFTPPPQYLRAAPTMKAWTNASGPG